MDFQSQPTRLKIEFSTVNVLIGICVAFYVFSLFANTKLMESMAFYTPLAGIEPWRALTSAFLHAGLLHLMCNMAFLYMLGGMMHGRFTNLQVAIIFFLSAWGGACGSLLWTNITGQAQLIVGASGGVFGLCGALYMNLRRGVLPSPSYSALGGLIVINILISFLIPGVAWQAHLGGLLIGGLLGIAYRYVAIASGRAGRRYIQAEIPDIVDRQRAVAARRRVAVVGDIAVVFVFAILLSMINVTLAASLPGLAG